ncbi:N-acetylglutamate synthase, GNAT family [Tenacibaculum sp. MAR_2009_124]|uniref:GNAT family N-acetyltransferase n=1 Tax=Tenacibaculum sp. MAR_2009_124 TaxID=1250059 RepID=UPI000895A9BF|nr:GNAT family N-acetyltransferase [Tenacibaculum sp. MAR_2009_124]SEB68057.1 N-acetylglutamate synthase, GNAT family [Tenacibaculum sp. MAR_2009_124]
MIRRYTIEDIDKLIELLDQNTPVFFDATEKTDYIDYLTNEIEDYFIYEVNKKIIGCGGINYDIVNRTARIAWDIIHPNHHGKGIGKKLTLHRINLIKTNINIDTIIVRTSQLTYKFYQKMGFQVDSVTDNFWAKGFDLYLMSLNTNKNSEH